MIENKILEVINKKIGNNYEVVKLGGMTNTNYLITLINGEKYVLKTFGKGTDKMIDREAAKNNIYQNQKLGIDVDIIMYDTNHGFLVSKYIDESITLDSKSIKDKFCYEKIADNLYKLHSSDLDFNNNFNVFDELRKYESIVGGIENITQLKNYKLNREIFSKLEENFKSLSPKACPCHNDLVPENFLRKDDKIYLIDWEYSGINDPSFDLAALFIESEFSSQEEEEFLKYYAGDVDDNTKQKIMLFKISQDFLWAVWSIYKFNCGVDYLQYGIDRYNRGVNMMNDYVKRYFNGI